MLTTDRRAAGKIQAEHLVTLQRVVDAGMDGIKLHPLHVVTGSILAKAWRTGCLQRLALENNTASAGETIRPTPGEVVYPRPSANARLAD